MSDQQPPQSDDLNFERALEHLEGIVSELEDGSLSLDDSLVRFEHGMKLLRQCHALLQQAEQKIEVLTSVNRDGDERTRPLTGSAQDEVAEAGSLAEDDSGKLF